MNKAHNPTTLHPTGQSYSHGVETPPSARLLFVSGQVPVARDGSVKSDIRAQCEQCFANLAEVLKSAGMEVRDLVKIQAFVVDADDFAVFREVRNRLVKAPYAASTAVVTKRLGRPEWKVEIEAVAARP